MDMEQGSLEREKNLIKLLSRENETYAKFELFDQRHGNQIIYVKGTWYPTHFIIFVLDGQDTWNFNATQDFVAHEASKLEMGVEEWVDQVHKYFCHQHVESQYAFVSTKSDFKMLQCSYFDKILGERNTINLVLHKTSSCGETAYHMFELLVDTNTKQQEELARKTRDIQRMAAEIRELRTNPEDHFRMENDSFRPHGVNSLSTSKHFQAESIDESNRGHNEDELIYDKNKEIQDTNQNIQYWTYDTSEDNPHPTLRPLENHFHDDDLNVQTQQLHEFHKSVSNHYDMNDISRMESGESSLLEPIEYVNVEDYDIPSDKKRKNELHHFSYVVPCHYVEGLLKNYPNSKNNSQSGNNQPTLYVYVAPKKIMIEKKIIVDTDFRENISMSGPSSYKQSTKSNKNNWSLKPPRLDNEMHYHNEFSSSMPTNESSDHLSIQLAVFDQVPDTNTTNNSMNDVNQHISFSNAPARHESNPKQHETNSSAPYLYPKKGSKVNFHHTTQEEKVAKVYYKTPKHSYSRSKFKMEDDEDEQIDFEIPSNAPRNQNRSYVVNSNEDKDDLGRRSRWSSPSQLGLHDLDLESPSDENKIDDHISEHYDDETNTIVNSESIVPIHESHNIDENKSDAHISEHYAHDTRTTINNESIVPIDEIHDINELNSTSDTHGIHSILHHKGDQHQHHEHINWGENETSDNFALGSQPHHLKIHDPREPNTHQEHVNLVGEFGEQLEPQSISNVSASKEDGEQKQPINEESSTTKSSISESNEPPSFLDEIFGAAEPSKSESNEPPSLLDEIYSKIDNLTTPSKSENTNQDTIQSNSTSKLESENEQPSLLDKIYSKIEDLTTPSVIESTNPINSTDESTTGILQEPQITKDKTVDNSNEIVGNKSKKRKSSSSKTPKMSKSTSFVQSFLSLFQGSKSDTKDSNDSKNDTKDLKNAGEDSSDPKPTKEENNANAVVPNPKSTTEKSNEPEKSEKSEDVSVISTIFSSFPGPFFSQPEVAQSDTVDKKDSQEEDTPNKTPENNEHIDDGQYDIELPHRKMDAVRKASVDEVRKELFLKLGNQKEQEPEETPPLDSPLDTLMENPLELELEDKFEESFDKEFVKGEESREALKNDKEGAPLEHVRHEPRRYSVDKIDLSSVRGMQQGSQSVSIGRTSLYSNLQGRSTKSTVQLQGIDEFDDDSHSMNRMVDVENNNEEKDLMNEEEDGHPIQEKFHGQSSSIHSKRASYDRAENKDQTSINHNQNENTTDFFQHFVPSVNETSTHGSNENVENNNRNSKDSISIAPAENHSDESVLCVARIRFVFPGRPTSLPMLQNHATSTSSTPNTSNFNVGLQFDNADAQGGGS